MPGVAGGGGPAVLVVEDDPVLGRQLVTFLAARAHRVAHAVSAEEALRLLAGDLPIAVALVDLHLPGVDGLELLRSLRKAHPHIQVIVMTGDADRNYVIEAMRLGAADFLTKPFRAAGVLAALDRVLCAQSAQSMEVRAAPPSPQSGLEGRIVARFEEVRTGQVTLPVMDPRVTKIRALSRDPGMGVEELIGVVGGDPAVVMGILQRANSGFYARSRPVQSVRAAAVWLGNREVLRLALQALVNNVFDIRSPALRTTWSLMQRNMSVTAMIAAMLGQLVDGIDPEDAYLWGLLHNLGEVAVLQFISDDHERAPEPLDLGALVALVEVHHEAVGELLAAQWPLDATMRTLMGRHHGRPTAADPAALRTARNVVMAAWAMAIERGYTYFPRQQTTDASPELAMLGLDLDLVWRRFERLPLAPA